MTYESFDQSVVQLMNKLTGPSMNTYGITPQPSVNDFKRRIERCRRAVEFQRDEVGSAVLATPTGIARNALCDAQIHLYAAMEALELAEKSYTKERLT